MHVPSNVVDNARLSRMMDTSDEWIRKRTGIVTRHFADPDQAASHPVPLTAIPYYSWNHRGTGEMAVWLRREGVSTNNRPPL